MVAEGESGGIGRVRRADMSMPEFFDTVSHELRTPVTTLKGLAQLLDGRWEDLTDQQRRESVTAMARQAERLAALVSGLLDLSRIEAGQLALELVPIDLAHVALRVIAVIAPPAETRVDLDVPVGTIVLADATYMDVVLSNLVVNAIRHGGDHIEVRSKITEDSVELAVTDDGPGIAVGQTDVIFDRFTRGRSSSGSGLGLALARALVELFDGTLTLESPDGGGARFVVRLPAPNLAG